MDIQEILNQGNYHLIDVREPEELIANGAIEGAENIPLGEVENHADEIRRKCDFFLPKRKPKREGYGSV